eukprot:GHVU01019087.1.p1 GENE.GHVU01019087.1~~GHVU01019087.1.p1  ORF type:complete len:199 (+),score=14.54 GHVU01019087.1:309-905(+)
MDGRICRTRMRSGHRSVPRGWPVRRPVGRPSTDDRLMRPPAAALQGRLLVQSSVRRWGALRTTTVGGRRRKEEEEEEITFIAAIDSIRSTEGHSEETTSYPARREPRTGSRTTTTHAREQATHGHHTHHPSLPAPDSYGAPDSGAPCPAPSPGPAWLKEGPAAARTLPDARPGTHPYAYARWQAASGRQSCDDSRPVL